MKSFLAAMFVFLISLWGAFYINYLLPPNHWAIFPLIITSFIFCTILPFITAEYFSVEDEDEDADFEPAISE